MSFLNTENLEVIASRLTNIGRERISQGNFNIKYFQIGDSEYDYNFSVNERVLYPLDFDCHIKYPIIHNNLPITGNTTYGIPAMQSYGKKSKDEMVIPGDGPSWFTNVVWSEHPAGYTGTTTPPTEYSSSIYTSAKEYFGYGKGYEEYHSIAILHFSTTGTTINDPDIPFIYEDYISHDTSDVNNFQVGFPNVLYNNISGSTGVTFGMGDTDKWLSSEAIDVRLNQIPYRDLLDNNGLAVGKIFYNHKIIVVDDQEMVAVLDNSSNRNYTLPKPSVGLISLDTTCNDNETTPLMNGTGDTLYVSYVLVNNDSNSNGLHCNYYSKITGTTSPSNAYIKFGANDFQYMSSEDTQNFSGHEFYILIQKVVNGEQPSPSNWIKVDITSEVITGGTIDKTKLQNKKFIITESDNSGSTYKLEPLLNSFGSNQVFNGTIRMARAIEIKVMRYFINLPLGTFLITQNPTWTSGELKITEVNLLNENREVLVVGKTTSPIPRIGSQVLAVKIDI